MNKEDWNAAQEKSEAWANRFTLGGDLQWHLRDDVRAAEREAAEQDAAWAAQFTPGGET